MRGNGNARRGHTRLVALLIPRDFDAAHHEITVLRLADGEGYATGVEFGRDLGVGRDRTGSTGLACTKVGLEPVGREMRATAVHVAGLRY